MTYVICVHNVMTAASFMNQLWERRSKVLTSEEKNTWISITTAMMSEEEVTDDGRISRRRPSWRSRRMNEWLDELDRRGTDMWKVARKERVDGPPRQLDPPDGLPAWMVNAAT